MQAIQSNSANFPVGSPHSSFSAISFRKGVRAVAEVCKVIWIIIKQWFSFSPYEIKELDLDHITPEMQEKLKDFESEFDYPLGEGKRFRIVHGKGGGDYFGFVKRLGIPKFYIAIHKKEREVTREEVVDGQVIRNKVLLKKGEIAGVVSAVLREIHQLKAWYICDLKVKKQYRGEHIPIRLFQKGFWRFFQCSKGYAICMNPGGGETPRAAHIWQQHGVLSSDTIGLNLYNIKAEDFSVAKKSIEKACEGPVAFKSMAGIKEFEIFQEGHRGTTEEWRILHIQHGPKGDPTVLKDPQPGHDHLIAAVEGTKLDQELNMIKNIPKFSTATIIYRGLDPAIFEHIILTNEI